MISGIVQLAEIDDFINPSQNCVKPILSNDKASAKINLADCLACNGCVTSAETILIQEHSIEKHFTLSENKLCVLLISNQSIESLSFYNNVSYSECVKVISNKLKGDIVFDLNEFNLLCLEESYKEFIERKNGIICSECPGWICYAEKKVGEKAFSYMSKLKSPQQLAAILLRETIAKYLKINKDDIYICSVMPCFDKKIESVRNKNEINCVLSTIELNEFFTQLKAETQLEEINFFKFISFNNLIKKYSGESSLSSIRGFISTLKKDTFITPNYHSPENFSSNEYVEYIISKLIKNNPKVNIERKSGKNIDIKEIILTDPESQKTIIFCVAYGFRNIQNIVRSIKSKKVKYDYIELMACPGGCINGGGQIRDKDNQPRKLLNHISEKIKKGSSIKFEEENEVLKNMEEIIGNEIGKETLSKINQQFNAIEFSMSDLKW